MLNIIVFSKNRACQLDLFLRSMKKFFKEFSDFKIRILYKYTNPDFEKGYLSLKEIHSDKNIEWKLDSNFQNCLIDIFDKTQKYSTFFVDDIIFKEPFSINDDRFKYFDSHGDILCLSMRLHPRLTYCYPASINMKSPEIKDGIFLWKGQDGDYGYPMSLDGHIFRSRDIFYYLVNLRYDGPNPLEAQMAQQPLYYPKMICYDRSIIMNNPINKVQEWNSNIHGNISAEFLNEKFLGGEIIDLTPFEKFDNISCHQELPVTFIKF
jgi:hypothetical protein